MDKIVQVLAEKLCFDVACIITSYCWVCEHCERVYTLPKPRAGYEDPTLCDQCFSESWGLDCATYSIFEMYFEPRLQEWREMYGYHDRRVLYDVYYGSYIHVDWGEYLYLDTSQQHPLRWYFDYDRFEKIFC